MSSPSSNEHAEAGELLQPILDVFSGVDGGVAFARLRHSFLPDMLAAQAEDPTAVEFVLMVRRFSKLCLIMQEK